MLPSRQSLLIGRRPISLRTAVSFRGPSPRTPTAVVAVGEGGSSAGLTVGGVGASAGLTVGGVGSTGGAWVGEIDSTAGASAGGIGSTGGASAGGVSGVADVLRQAGAGGWVTAGATG